MKVESSKYYSDWIKYYTALLKWGSNISIAIFLVESSLPGVQILQSSYWKLRVLKYNFSIALVTGQEDRYHLLQSSYRSQHMVLTDCGNILVWLVRALVFIRQWPLIPYAFQPWCVLPIYVVPRSTWFRLFVFRVPERYESYTSEPNLFSFVRVTKVALCRKNGKRDDFHASSPKCSSGFW